MLHPNIDMAVRLGEERMRDSLRRAETERILREAGIERRSWSRRLTCLLLSGVGHVLVELGRRLQAYALPAGPSANRNSNHPASVRR